MTDAHRVTPTSSALGHSEAIARLIELRSGHTPRRETAEALRERIERNLHDGMQQRLVSLAMWLGLLDAKLPSEPDAAKRLVRETRQQLSLALEDLRELTEGRDPTTLAKRGLEAALEELCRGAGIPAQLSLSVHRWLPAEVEAAAYYMVSEALTNAVKHSHARELQVAASSEGDVLSVEVADDGVGGANADGGSGLTGLAARIEALGGRLQVSSPVGDGTSLHALIPCRSRRARGMPADRNGKTAAVRLGTARQK